MNGGWGVGGTFPDLRALGADVVAIGALLALGDAIAEFATEHHVALELLERMPNNLWTPAECPLCATGIPLEVVGISERQGPTCPGAVKKPVYCCYSSSEGAAFWSPVS